MAAQRPLVLVYQEFAQQNFTAATPDLVTLIAGPAYHFMDSPGDAAAASGGEYGTKFNVQAAIIGGEASVYPYVEGATASVLSDAPGNVLGAVLDASSVKLFFSEAYVLVPGSAGEGGAYDNTINMEHTFSSATDFEAAGVLPGDILVTDDAGTVVTRVVVSVDTTNIVVSTAYAEDGLDAHGVPYVGASFTGLKYRVERRLTHVETTSPDNIVVSGNQITVLGNHTVTLPGTTTAATVMYGEMYFAYKSLRQDLALVGEISDARLIESSVGKIDERNPLAVALHLALQNTTSSISYFGITGDNLNGDLDRLQAYQAMAAETESYKDIYALVPLTEDLSVIAALKTVVEGSAIPEVSQYKSLIGNLGQLPVTKTIVNASTAEPTHDATLSNYVVDVGVNTSTVLAGDVFVQYGADVNVPEYLLLTGPTDGLTGLATAAPIGTGETWFGAGGNTWWIDRPSTSFGAIEIAAATVAIVAPGVVTVPDADYDPAHEFKIIELTFADVANDGLSSRGDNLFFVESISAGGVGFMEYTLSEPVIWAANDTVSAKFKEPVLYDVGGTLLITGTRHIVIDSVGTFLDSGVVVGDLLEVTLAPTVLTADDYSTLTFTYPIAAVLSNNQVRLAVGADVVQDDYGSEDGISYRVIRTLDKPGQVSELISIAESISSSRVLAVWPDQVKVSGVQNNATGTQSFLPGYYMAVVVGAMTAGLPPQQGFTNLGIAGISEIRHSSRYFSEAQLTTLSNSGIYLFAQNTPNTLPYCVHQLTTDVSTLESGEFSMVKNFDYVSRFYKDIVDDFIGRYNVTDSTIGLMKEALDGGSRQLQRMDMPRIGAPLIAGRVASIKVLEGQRDHVEVMMDLTLPAPLNRVTMRLVA
jgi:hypothetical protein